MIEKIRIDGKATTEFTTEKGSVIVKLKPSFLETLKVGEHTIRTFYSDGGTAAGTFKIANDSSDSGSSSKSSGSKRVDNVVTCQMAGFPSNYVWNESAKACQAGYIDAGGNFHSYTTQTNLYKRNTPNTGDIVLDFWTFGMMFGLTMATAAGVKLVHEEW